MLITESSSTMARSNQSKSRNEINRRIVLRVVPSAVRQLLP
jgi:hypothetical protein